MLFIITVKQAFLIRFLREKLFSRLDYDENISFTLSFLKGKTKLMQNKSSYFLFCQLF